MKKIILRNSFEGEFINYYEKFFIHSRENQVKQEISYIRKCLKNHSSGVNQLLDVGCGTGYHADKLSGYFTEIAGLDISKDMITYADKMHKQPNLGFSCQDIRNYKSPILYDAAIALSHVIGYQLENSEVEEMLTCINKSLKCKGILLFNFYYAPAIFKNGLAAKIKTVCDDETEITRYSNATLITEENALSLDYIYFIEDTRTEDSGLFKINIHEKMRYFSKLEMDYFLQKAGFLPLHYYNHLTENSLDSGNWNACIIAEKIIDK